MKKIMLRVVIAIFLFFVTISTVDLKVEAAGTKTINGLTFTEWTETDSLPYNGNYYLSSDIYISETQLVNSSRTVNLALEGHNIYFENSYYDVMGTLILRDSTKNPGSLISTGDYAFKANNGTIQILNDIRIESEKIAINLSAKSTLDIAAGEIVGGEYGVYTNGTYYSISFGGSFDIQGSIADIYLSNASSYGGYSGKNFISIGSNYSYTSPVTILMDSPTWFASNSDGSSTKKASFEWADGGADITFTSGTGKYEAVAKKFDVIAVGGQYGSPSDTEYKIVSLSYGTKYTPSSIYYYFDRTGYKQTGFSLSDGGEKIDSFVVKGTTYLYPYWEKTSNDITYAPGEYGIGEIETTLKNKGQSCTLSTEVFTSKYYVQTGWSLTDGGEKAYELGGTYSDDADITLYPYWEEKDLVEITSNVTMVNSTASVNGASVKSNDTITVTYTITKNTVGIDLLSFALAYDTDAFEIVSTTANALIGEATVSADNINIIYESLGTLIDGIYTPSYTSTDEVLVTVVYKLKDSADAAKVYEFGIKEISNTQPIYAGVVNPNTDPASHVEIECISVNAAEVVYKGTPTLTIAANQGKTYDKEVITSGLSEADVIYSYTFAGNVIALEDSDLTIKWYDSSDNLLSDAPTNAGTYKIGIAVIEKALYDAVVEIKQTVVINPANITIAVNDKTATYGSISLGNYSYEITSGTLYGDDDLGCSYTTTVTENSTVGSYDINVSTTNTNYNVTAVAGIYTVTKATNTWVNELIIFNHIYDGNTFTKATSSTLDNKNNYYATTTFGEVLFEIFANEDDTVALTTWPTNAGTYYISAYVLDTTNYSGLTSEKVAITITKQEIDVTTYIFRNGSFEYDATEHSITVENLNSLVTVSYSGGENSETLDEAKRNKNYAISKGDYLITATFALTDVNNYAFSSNGNTLTATLSITVISISQAELDAIVSFYQDNTNTELTGNTYNLSYDGNGHFIGVMIAENELIKTSFLYNEVAITATSTIDNTKYAKVTDAGTYTVNIVFEPVLGYAFDEGVGSYQLTIDIAKIDGSISINSNEEVKTYDAVAVTIGTNNEDITYTATTDGTVNVAYYADNNGSKGELLVNAPINAGTYWVGVTSAEGTNYNAVIEVSKKFVIAKANYTITGTTISQYYGDVASSIEPTTTGTIYNDDFTINKTIKLNDEELVDYVFTNTSNVGNYSVIYSVSGEGSDNYDITIINTTYTISKAQASDVIIVINAIDKIYDATDLLVTANISIKGIEITATPSIVFYASETDYNADTNSLTTVKNVGTYYVKVSVSGTDNYEGNSNYKTVIISPKTLTVSVSDYSLNVATFTIEGFAGSETVADLTEFTYQVEGANIAGNTYTAQATTVGLNYTAATTNGNYTITGGTTKAVYAISFAEGTYDAAISTETVQNMPTTIYAFEDEEITNLGSNPTLKHYQFLAWSETLPFTVTADKTITASWQVLPTYTLNYMVKVDNGTYSAYSNTATLYADDLVSLETLNSISWFKNTTTWYTDQALTVEFNNSYLTNNTTLYGSYTFDIGLGDCNADGKIDANDILIYRQYLVGGYDVVLVNSGDEFEIAQNLEVNTKYFLLRVADLNSDNASSELGDDSIDIRDVSTIRMSVVGGYGYVIEENIVVTGEAIIPESQVASLQAIDEVSIDEFNAIGNFEGSKTFVTTTGTIGEVITEETNSYYQIENPYLEMNTVVMQLNVVSLETGTYQLSLDVLEGFTGINLLVSIDNTVIGNFNDESTTTVTKTFEFSLDETKDLINIKLTFLATSGALGAIDNVSITKK